jgi:hypothetical protein
VGGVDASGAEELGGGAGAGHLTKGAEFVTPPIDREAEIRCYMRDPDGYLIEVGQARVSRQGCPWRNAAAGIVASFLTTLREAEMSTTRLVTYRGTSYHWRRANRGGRHGR